LHPFRVFWFECFLNNMPFKYNDTPDQKVFNEIKEVAIDIWKTDDPCNYATDKINRIKDIDNFKDNAWYIVAMFDLHNQAKLMEAVSEETKQQILLARGY